MEYTLCSTLFNLCTIVPSYTSRTTDDQILHFFSSCDQYRAYSALYIDHSLVDTQMTEVLRGYSDREQLIELSSREREGLGLSAGTCNV